MISIEEEILELFVTSRRQTEHKARNARVALAYYGFSNDILPKEASLKLLEVEKWSPEGDTVALRNSTFIRWSLHALAC